MLAVRSYRVLRLLGFYHGRLSPTFRTESSKPVNTLILVSEMMVPAVIGEGELPIVCMDMSMMNMGGKERSEKQFADILTAAGLELTRVWEGFGTDRLLEAQLASPTHGGEAKANGHTSDGPVHDTVVKTNSDTSDGSNAEASVDSK